MGGGGGGGSFNAGSAPFAEVAQRRLKPGRGNRLPQTYRFTCHHQGEECLMAHEGGDGRITITYHG